MTKNQWVGVGVGLLVVSFFLMGGSISRFFSNPKEPFQLSMAPDQSNNLMAKDEVVGSGEVAMAGDILTVHYTGQLSDGTVFDSSLVRGQPFQFVLGAGQVIKGWDQGLVGMKVGGKRLLSIPPELGYGANQIGPIPANSTLIFEVELLEVKKPTQ